MVVIFAFTCDNADTTYVAYPDIVVALKLYPERPKKRAIAVAR